MARPKKYTAAALRKAVDAYFAGISRTRVITEDLLTGELDKFGHPLYAPVAVKGDNGKPLTERQWVRPPTVGGLCRALGVHRSTWSEWHDGARYPEFAEIVESADDTIQEYLEAELLTREGKNVRGVEFALSANYGLSEKKSVEISGAAPDIAGMSDEELLRIITTTKGETT